MLFPASCEELRRRVDIGEGGGIPGLGTVYLELLGVYGDVLPDRTEATSENSGSLSKPMWLLSIILLNLKHIHSQRGTSKLLG